MSGEFVVSSALSLALLAAACGTRPADPPAPLVGAWRSSIRFTSGPFASVKDLEFMYVFNAGGTMTESSNYDAAPPVPPAYGVWRAVAPNEFEAKYEFFTTTPSVAVMKNGGTWLPSGRGVLTERIKLSADARSFTSTLRYEALGIKGEPVDGSGEAEGKAVRIGY